MKRAYTYWTISVAAAAAISLSAQQQEQERPAGDAAAGRMGAAGRMMGEGGFDQTMLLLRILDDPDAAEVVKLTDEQREGLKKGMAALDRRRSVVAEALRVASLEQAALAAKVMADKQAATNELMELVGKIGGLRTEQARIQTERLLVIRDTLSADQIRAATDLAQKRVERMRETIRQRLGGKRRGAAGGEGRDAARGGGGRDRARGGDNPRNAPAPQRPEGWDE